jgi:hypothetical protein
LPVQRNKTLFFPAIANQPLLRRALPLGDHFIPIPDFVPYRSASIFADISHNLHLCR